MSPREEGNAVASVVGHAGADCVRSSEKGSSLRTCHVLVGAYRIFLPSIDVEESSSSNGRTPPAIAIATQQP